MSEAMRQWKRVQPVIKAKKARMDEESGLLARIHQEKVEVVSQMKENQRKYMEGVERLNQVRASSGRESLESLERGLDSIKSQWFKLYQDVQELENKERAQIAQVLTAERELKAVQKLEEKYQLEWKKDRQKADQNALDEAVLRKIAVRGGNRNVNG